MRLAIVTESFLPRTDGVVRTVLELLQYLRAHGHDALVFAAGPGPDVYDGFEVIRVQGPRFPLYPALTVAPFSPRMIGRLREWQPDVIHLASPFVLGVQGLLAGRRLEIPVAAHYQTNIAHYARYFHLGALEGIARAHLRLLHNGCHRTFAPTEGVRQDLIAQGVQRVRVLGRGVDSVLFTPARRSEALRHSLLQDGEHTLLLNVGRLSSEKNLGMLLPMIGHLNGARLVLVGEGPRRAALERQFAGLPVTFLGLRQGEELATLYASADAFVFPSLTETFGQVVQEAMASALPVLAFAAGGVRDLFRDGVEGFLCAPDDNAQWIDRAELLVANAPLRVRLGLQGRLCAEERTWHRVIAALLLEYGALCQEHSRRHAGRRAAYHNSCDTYS